MLCVYWCFWDSILWAQLQYPKLFLQFIDEQLNMLTLDLRIKNIRVNDKNYKRVPIWCIRWSPVVLCQKVHIKQLIFVFLGYIICFDTFSDVKSQLWGWPTCSIAFLSTYAGLVYFFSSKSPLTLLELQICH